MKRYRAIDVHAHVGAYADDQRSAATRMRSAFFSGTLDTVLSRARAVNIDCTIVSAYRALMPHGGDPLRGNAEVKRAVERASGVLFWAVLNPTLTASWEQVERLVLHPRCMGIKIHPVMHGYDIRQYGKRIFGFADRHRIVVSTHSGQKGAHPRHFVPFLNAFPDVPVILAHLGNSDTPAFTDQAHAVRLSRGDRVYVDTSSSRSLFSGLIEWAVREIGSDKILFGSDSPIHSAAAEKARIEYAGISEADKQNILFRNAQRLLGAKLKHAMKPSHTERNMKP